MGPDDVVTHAVTSLPLMPVDLWNLIQAVTFNPESNFISINFNVKQLPVGPDGVVPKALFPAYP